MWFVACFDFEFTSGIRDLLLKESELEDDEPISVAFWLPMLLFVSILVIVVSAFLDKSFTRFDRNWIHRVGGSSGGIVLILIVLFLVLKCRASM